MKILVKIHFIVLTIVLLNALFKNFTNYALEGNTEFVFEILTAISGLILFFFYIKPFGKINFYFSIYAAATFLLIIALIFRGLIGALVISLVLYPIIPDEKEYEQNGIIVSTPFQGVIASCCSYQIKERKLMIFEKDHGIIETNGTINFETLKIISDQTKIELIYTLESDSKTYTKKIDK